MHEEDRTAEKQSSHNTTRQWSFAGILIGLALFIALVLAASASAAECTDTWTGPTEGRWEHASNWSTGNVPGKSTVACVGAGKTVEVQEGTNVVSIVQGEGSIRLLGGTLELEGPAEASPIGSLRMVGGSIGGPGTIEVSETFLDTAGGRSQFGTGSTVILPGAEATFEAENAPLYERHLVNQGTVNLAGGSIMESAGAEILNEGIFKFNAEGYWPAIQDGGGPYGSSRFVNDGTFEKTTGTGRSTIEVPFTNRGTVDAETGAIEFFAGGSSTSTARWESAEGATVDLDYRHFSIIGGVWAGDIIIGPDGATATARGVDAKAAQVTVNDAALDIEGPAMTVEALDLHAGTIEGPGTLDISNSFRVSEANSRLSGSGRTVILHGAEGSISEELIISEYHLINRSALTVPNNGRITERSGAEVLNEGTFTLNSEWVPPTIADGGEPYGSSRFVNEGTLEKTAGTGWSEIGVPVENSGQIRQLSGHLEIQHEIRVRPSAATPDHCNAGDPVDCATGDFTESQTDFAIGGRGVGLTLTRAYSSQAAAAGTTGIFGHGWTNTFGTRLTVEESGAKETLTDSSGGTTTFTKSGAAWISPSWSKDILSGSAETGFTLTLPDQTKEQFSGAGRLESVTDRNGNETTLAYSGSGELKTITDPSGRSITLTYNGAGLVESAEDPMGHVVHYTYASGDLSTVTLAGEASPNWRFGYDYANRMTSMEDGRGGVTTNEYDGTSRVISQTDPMKRKTTFEYGPFHTTITNESTGAVTDEWFDSNNQPVSVTHGYGTADASTVEMTYTAAGLLASRTDGDGHTTTYGYDAEGNRTSETDPEGDETTWTYNEAHEVTSETASNGEKTTITRNADGDPETVSRPAPGKETQTVSYEYGPHGELESMTDPLGHLWTFGYDKYGDRISAADPEGDERTWAYNEDSQPISTVSPRGNEAGAEPAKFTTSIERDAQGRPIKVTDPLGGTTNRSYDADGNLESVTDPNGHETKFTYDADDELTKVERPNGAIEETEYDGAGQVVGQTNGDKDETTYVRNILEQPVEIIDPLERKTVQTFDEAGNLLTTKDPDGRTTTYGYDKADRLKEVSYSAEPGQDATFGYDEDGDLTSMKDASGESTWEYDQLGRLVHSENGNGETVAWEYNLADEPVGLTYPNGKSISRAYDEVGRLESVTDWLGHTTSFAYNRDSEPTATTFPTSTGDKDEYAFDRADRMSAVTMKKGAETLASLAYTRDPAGQLESLVSKGLPGAEEESFAYDENERLTKAGSNSYEYDAANNLTKAPGTTNAFDKASEIESATGAAFTFDKEGERTKETPSSGPATTYKYDQAGELTAIERPKEGETPAISESFGYDGNGLMASRTVGLTTAHFVWDLSESPEPLLSDGADSYIYGPNGMPFEQISSEEVPTYLHHDQLGSTRLLTNASGEATGTFTYGAYGALTGHTGTATTVLGYAGQYMLGQSGLQYLRARFYDPATAQFLTLDPSVGETRAPYFYVGDNPTGRVDRTGRSSESIEVPNVWPFTPPSQSAVEPIEEVVESIGEFFGGGSSPAPVTAPAGLGGWLGLNRIASKVGSVLNQAKEESDDQGCDPKELVREGEEILGRGHNPARGKRWQEWWETLGRAERKAYDKAGGPRARSRG